MNKILRSREKESNGTSTTREINNSNWQLKWIKMIVTQNVRVVILSAIEMNPFNEFVNDGDFHRNMSTYTHIQTFTEVQLCNRCKPHCDFSLRREGASKETSVLNLTSKIVF